jgi:YggT family protein
MQLLLQAVNALWLLYIIVVLVRFTLQLARADFYNPVSQAVVKLTSPLLFPLRKLIPNYRQWDFASLILAVLLYFLKITFFVGFLPVHLHTMLFFSLGSVAYWLCEIYFFAIIIAAISSWIPPIHQHPVTLLVWQMVEPVQAPFRRILPNLGGIDISPILVLLILQILQAALYRFTLI